MGWGLGRGPRAGGGGVERWRTDAWLILKVLAPSVSTKAPALARKTQLSRLAGPHPFFKGMALMLLLAGRPFLFPLHTLRSTRGGQSVVRVMDNLCRVGPLCG